MIWVSVKMESWLAGLLRAAWVAGILPLIIASLPSSRLNSFHGALLGFAKRGKIMQSSSHVRVQFSFFLRVKIYLCHINQNFCLCCVFELS